MLLEKARRSAYTVFHIEIPQKGGLDGKDVPHA